jgi:hypothetical protein
MSLQYPVLYKSTDPKVDGIVKGAINTAIADAEKLWAPEKFDGPYAVGGFGITRLEKWHLAPNAAGTDAGTAVYTNSWLLSIGTARTWSQVMSDTITDSAYPIICGIFNLDAAPDVTHLQIIADGVTYPSLQVEEIYGWDVATAYFSHPIIVRPEKNFQVKARAETAGQKQFGLLGWTIAKRGYLINTI